MAKMKRLSVAIENYGLLDTIRRLLRERMAPEDHAKPISNDVIVDTALAVMAKTYDRHNVAIVDLQKLTQSIDTEVTQEVMQAIRDAVERELAGRFDDVLTAKEAADAIIGRIDDQWIDICRRALGRAVRDNKPGGLH